MVVKTASTIESPNPIKATAKMKINWSLLEN